MLMQRCPVFTHEDGIDFVTLKELMDIINEQGLRTHVRITRYCFKVALACGYIQSTTYNDYANFQVMDAHSQLLMMRQEQRVVEYDKATNDAKSHIFSSPCMVRLGG